MATKIIYLLSVATLKTLTTISDNIDEKLIGPEILTAQDLYIHPLLGTALFRKLLDLVDTNAIRDPANENYKNLLDDHLRPALINYTLSEIPETINFQFSNKGVLTKTSENSQAPEIGNLYAVAKRYKTRAEIYSERTRNYLRANPDKFPEYRAPGIGADVIHPERDVYQESIYLPD